jgi:hypothetical protein
MRERVQRTVEIMESESKEDIYVEIRSGGGGRRERKCRQGTRLRVFYLSFLVTKECQNLGFGEMNEMVTRGIKGKNRTKERKNELIVYYFGV